MPKYQCFHFTFGKVLAPITFAVSRLCHLIIQLRTWWAHAQAREYTYNTTADVSVSKESSGDCRYWQVKGGKGTTAWWLNWHCFRLVLEISSPLNLQACCFTEDRWIPRHRSSAAIAFSSQVRCSRAGITHTFAKSRERNSLLASLAGYRLWGSPCWSDGSFHHFGRD